MLNLVVDKRSEIIMHFNKMHLQDPSIPMWVIKVKGNTYYVDHVDVEPSVGFSTKETPSNSHTKGSLKFKGKLEIKEGIARIYL
jgi:hypothetical protein